MRGRSAGLGLAIAVVAGLLAAPSAGAEPGDAPVELAAQTVLTGERSARFAVELTAPAVVDLAAVSGENGTLPAALSVGESDGFAGFALSEPGGLDGAAVVAVRLPEAAMPESELVSLGTQAGQASAGIGWGQDADGQACTVCALPAGSYELQLIATGSQPVAVTVHLDGLSGTTTLHAEDGAPTLVWAHSQEPTEGPSSDPAPASGGFKGVWSGTSWPRTGVLVDHMALRVAARATPATAVSRFCRSVEKRDCDEREQVVTDAASAGAPRITAGHVTTDGMLGAEMEWNIVGDATYRAIQRTLWVPLVHSGPPVLGTDAPPEPELRALRANW